MTRVTYIYIIYLMRIIYILFKMSDTISLAYVFSGKIPGNTYSVFPEYFYENIYQIYLVHLHEPIPIYIITDQYYVQSIHNKLDDMNISDEFRNTIRCIEIESLSSVQLNIPRSLFKMNFFYAAFMRFVYLYQFMKQHQITNLFHIEYDVMMYTHFRHIYNLLKSKQMCSNLIVVQDSATRALGSIVFADIPDRFNKFIQFTNKVYEQNKHIPNLTLNEMDLLGGFPLKQSFPNYLDDPLLREMGYFDGACIGQYLGGVDRRSPFVKKCGKFENPSVGFVNETSITKPDKLKFSEISKLFDSNGNPLRTYWFTYKNVKIPIHNLHIHSKMLYNFSSQFQFQYDDLISGEKILSLCDIVICEQQNIEEHTNVREYNSNVIIFQDTEEAYTSLNKKLELIGKDIISIGLYTHTSKVFMQSILPKVNPDLRFCLYFHNSDDIVDRFDFLSNPQIHKIYAQHINNRNPKAHLLPIGIANSMYSHGNLDTLYEIMTNTYYLRKNQSIYVNMDTTTFAYRQQVLNKIFQYRFAGFIQKKPFRKYLEELSYHRFCLCVRGNGIDTHRFWESLYLGVIPVIINNKHTECSSFVDHLRTEHIPFYEITHFTEFIKSHDQSFFSEKLYRQIMSDNVGYKSKLKLNYYKNEVHLVYY